MSIFRVFVNLFQFNRTNWKAVTLCFATATVFWFFSALNKNHTTNIKFPLHFEYDHEKYTPASDLPQHVTLNVSGNGWDLFRKHFGIKLQPLTINLEKPAEKRRLAGMSMLSTFASQLGNLQVNFVSTDSIRVHIEETTSREFKLAVDLSNASFRKEFGKISPVVILPDSVELKGPKSIIKSLPDSIVLRLDQKKIDKNFREQIEVVIPYSEFIKRNPPVAEVIFEVGSMIEMTKWVKLKNDAFNWGTEFERDSVQAVFKLAQRDGEAFANTRVAAALNLTLVKKGETKFLIPRIEEVPPWIELIHIDSVKVKRY
ncbi:MAG TPA: hypothetical protein VIT44_10035 [Cyclobacteriaceae bacterium]